MGVITNMVKIVIMNFHYPEASFFYIYILGYTPCKSEQPLRGMELQEKEAQKDYSIQEICLERTYS